MIIFIDFDDVLFNTKKFKEDLKNLFFQQDITQEIFDKYYHNPKQDKILKIYNPWEQLDRIVVGENMDIKKTKEELENFMFDTTAYLFEDSVEFLKNFKTESVYIVSYGESRFQEMKINKCGADVYCEKMHITDELKSSVIEKIMQDRNQQKEDIFFIEDRIEQLEDVKKKFPKIKTIFIRRTEGRYHDAPTRYCDFEARNLREAERIIKNN